MSKCSVIVISSVVAIVAQTALAQGKVTKQKGCDLLVSGISGAKVNAQVSIIGSDAPLSGTIIKAKGDVAVVRIQAQDCPSLAGASVTLAPNDDEVSPSTPQDSSAPQGLSSVSQRNRKAWSVGASAAYTTSSILLADSSVELLLTNPEYGVVATYSHPYEPKWNVLFGLMSSYFRGSYLKQLKVGGEMSRISHEIMAVVLGPTVGAEFVARSIRVAGNLFYGYAVAKSYTQESIGKVVYGERVEVKNKEIGVRSYQRLGAEVAVESEVDRSLFGGFFLSYSRVLLATELSNSLSSGNAYSGGLRVRFAF